MNVKDNYRDDSALRRRRSFYSHEVKPIKIMEKIGDKIIELKPTSVLDVACGYGDVLMRLREEKNFAGRLVGIDISPGMLEKPIAQAQKQHLDITFLSADGEALPFADNEFDLISCNFALYEFEDCQKAVQEARRCLKTGGHYIAGLHQPNNRPKFMRFMQMVMELLPEIKVEIPQQKMNLELIMPYLKYFSAVEVTTFDSPIRLTGSAPFIDYFDTYQNLAFSPEPRDDEWAHALEKVRQEVESEIRHNGFFEEMTELGYFLARK